MDDNARGDPRRANIISVLDYFTIHGPNGTHMCYASQVGGPSMAQISDSSGQAAGSRRLRAPLARHAAGQLADTISLVHSLGIIHGGLEAAAASR